MQKFLRFCHVLLRGEGTCEKKYILRVRLAKKGDIMRGVRAASHE